MERENMLRIWASENILSDSQKEFIGIFRRIEATIETKLQTEIFFKTIEDFGQDYYISELPNEFIWKSYSIHRDGYGKYICSFSSHNISFTINKLIEEENIDIFIERVSDHLVKMYKLSSNQYDHLGEAKK